MAVDIGLNNPFAEQLEFFRNKLALPSERYDDILRAAHDRAFIVAGAAQADLVNDLFQAMTRRVEDGKGLEAFRKEFNQVVLKHGWTGWTGEGSERGYAWRTRVIYQTNMSTSYAAGRWRQLTSPALLSVRPFWKYHHADGVMHPRPLHVSWHGLVLPYDHPFWRTHFPPNGWMCHCWVTAVDAKEYEKALAEGRATPPAGWQIEDPVTGALPGIDRGFNYAPGANTDTSLRQMVQDKLITYPRAIEKALSREVNRYINAQEPVAEFVAGVLADRSRIDPLWLGFVENVEEVSEAAGLDVTGYMVLLPAEAPRHVERSHGHDGGGQRAATPEDFARIATVLAQADHVQQGHLTAKEMPAIVVTKEIDGELYRAVFEVRPGKRNRALALVSLVIKTVY